MAKTTTKKKWFSITAPKIFNDVAVGETPGVEPKDIIGKTVTVNLATLSDDMKDHTLEVTLLFENLEDDKVKTGFIGYRVIPTSIRRVVRKGRTRADISMKLITKDDKVVTIKILLITRKIVKGSVSSALEAETRRVLTKKISSLDYDSVSELVIFGKLEGELNQRLNKIYPLKVCEIKEFNFERFIKAVELRKVKAELLKESKKQSRKKKVEDEETETEEPAPVEGADKAEEKISQPDSAKEEQGMLPENESAIQEANISNDS